MTETLRVPPKFLQIVQELRRAIAAGELRPGDEVPSERALAAQWQVARPTAARALQTLRAEGLIEPRRGTGTFVRGPAVHAGVPVARSPAEGEQDPGHHELVRVRTARPPSDVAVLFGLPVGSTLCCRHRIARDGLGPVEVSTSWFEGSTATAAPRLLEPRPLAEGEVHHLEAGTGRRAVRIADHLSARLAGADEARVLHLDRPAALLQVRRVWRDVDSRILLLQDSVHPPRLGGLHVEWPVA